MGAMDRLGSSGQLGSASCSKPDSQTAQHRGTRGGQPCGQHLSMGAMDGFLRDWRLSRGEERAHSIILRTREQVVRELSMGAMDRLGG